jgi:hypothetical protein
VELTGFSNLILDFPGIHRIAQWKGNGHDSASA